MIAIAKKEGKLTGFCIGNTTKVDTHGLFFSPIRNTKQLVAGSVIVYEAHHSEEIARIVDGRVQYILVDTEKKVGPDPKTSYGIGDMGNIEGAVRDAIQHSTLLTYKGNDLTVNSIDCALSQLMTSPIQSMGGKKVTIIGAGNLGAKLALKLVERGAHVVITRRNKKKLEVIVQALNYIKPGNTVAVVEGMTDNELAARDAHLLIGMAVGPPVITETMVSSLAKNAIIMDGGKGCLHPLAVQRAQQRQLKIFRVDIRSGFEGEVAMLLEMHQLLKHTVGRRQFDGIPVVSGGLFAWKDEIVVDNIHHPTAIFGIADGQGDFMRQLSQEQSRNLERLDELIANESFVKCHDI